MVEKNIKVALVCIAKEEDNYIHEWVNYYLNVGVDDIYIYQNNWRTNILHEQVKLIPFDGEARQLPAYNDFLNNYKEKYDWACFFDVDEFLLLKKHNNIKEFISQYSGYNSIAINWVLFGDNNMEEVVDGNYSVIERFTKCENGVNRHIKSIVKMNCNAIYNQQPHSTTLPWVDTNYNIGTGPFNYRGDNNIAQINHYFCKTKTEFIKKLKRGLADISSNISRPITDYDLHNKNEIEDRDAFELIKKHKNHFIK